MQIASNDTSMIAKTGWLAFHFKIKAANPFAAGTDPELEVMGWSSLIH
jgi:hypothetical protein